MLCPMALPPRLGLVVILLALLGLAAATSSSNANSPRSSSAPETVQDAKSMVHQALKALAVVNKDRINHPAFNKHEFKEVTAEQPAALLRYKSEPASLSLRNTAGDDDNSSSGYRIPTELSHAARVLAESTPQEPKGNHSQVAEAARKKHSKEGSTDTNTPKPRKTPEGLLSKFADSPKEKRASGYWMIDDQKHPGESPYATPDYKYYNTQFLGDPINVPTILAASSFVGLGVFTSNKYVADDVGWYLNTANFLRSIRNFKIDIRLTDPGAYVYGIHWQDFIIESCESGMVVTGGSGGPNSKGQTVGSLVLADSIIANTQNGIVTLLHAENVTSLLVQNVGFFNVKTAISDSAENRVLLGGGDEVHLDSWGFGKITDAKGISKFVNGERVPAMNRTEELLGIAYDKMKPNLFTRRRPKYYNVPNNKVMNVKALGAKGDGKTDDTAVLNSILDGAANISSIVYFPYGVYIIKDILCVPMGSRIIGQAWSQIMATGSRFEDERNLHIAVQWNAQEAIKGSVGMWNSHFRVGGAAGSNLQTPDCAKSTGSVDPKCKAASMLLHLTSGSTAYLENVWAWVADHDIDDPKQTQISVYAARGILIESQRAWLWATSSEHSTLYQYQLTGAKNILMGMIQTESPYYQPVPRAPSPFRIGHFPDDPCFQDCKTDRVGCYSSWALRIIDSSAIYVLGAGLYSWFSDYDQKCVEKGNCQDRAVEVQQSDGLWIYNLCTKGTLEMVSPYNGNATLAKDNINGYRSSILAWLEGASEVSGPRPVPGFQLYTGDGLRNVDVPDACKKALSSKIICDQYITRFQEPSYRGSPDNEALTESICGKSCGKSLADWFNGVEAWCHGYNISRQLPTTRGGRMWAGVNETCVKDSKTGEYCNDIIDKFTEVDRIDEMPYSEVCSECYIKKLAMMQSGSYSAYDEWFQDDLKLVYKTCGKQGPTDIPPSLDPVPEDESSTFCISDNIYRTSKGESTCEKVALKNNLSPAALYNLNSAIHDCGSIPAGTELCLPLACARLVKYSQKSNCTAIEKNEGLSPGSLRRFNPWINRECSNLNSGGNSFCWILCAEPQDGEIPQFGAGDDTVTPHPSTDYTAFPVNPPNNATAAQDTTTQCGRWHVTEEGDTCASICMSTGIHISLLLAANPSLGKQFSECSAKLVVERAYCTGPTYDWGK
ncbi:hypothetical protein NCS57_01465700 [Fusarium keratoplasticum]|uniref:Uncharacterized protein n=1 Tax=Fusarium keratoplasticum TaxID=1328300 RepID=A0ACC0QD64_9HYPO|nr:hypothetical protein NCS57_01465700 [Fusarium keratoplasticum]KAI8649290.1 hypothetical protein NCS57_01465700 [Fusarium keratoplasticum]